MADPLTLHSASSLLSAFCTTITNDIHPLSATAVAQGSKLFGAAILLKSDLSLVHAGTNHEGSQVGGSPIWHGETWTIKEFFEIPQEIRPDVKECLFLTTHEPCSLCLNAITWAGFDNFCYMWTYEETERLFGISGDLDVWERVFYREEGVMAQQACLDENGVKREQRRPEYRLRNKYFVATSFAELVASVEDEGEREMWMRRVEEVKKRYGSLSETYRTVMRLEVEGK